MNERKVKVGLNAVGIVGIVFTILGAVFLVLGIVMGIGLRREMGVGSFAFLFAFVSLLVFLPLFDKFYSFL